MRNRLKQNILLCLSLLGCSYSLHSQSISNIGLTEKKGLTVTSLKLSDSSQITFPSERPLYSFLLDDKLYNSGEAGASKTGDQHLQIFSGNVNVTYLKQASPSSENSAEITFENRGNDTVSVSNVMPFGIDDHSVYITGKGPWDLARAYLFRPGVAPVRVILPDNAWELGYNSFAASKDISVCALARRTGNTGAIKGRYETRLPPQAKVVYTIYTGIFRGEWQNGLRTIFRDHYLYDLKDFDNSLFKREDLAWIKESYLIILQMAWDREFFDRFTGKYTFTDVLKKGNELFGKVDVYGVWPTWPRLGLDERNQWDLYRDLPGGTGQLRNFVRLTHQSGSRFFIAYNPWDNSTREENHMKGMSALISETEADGVVLDTKGSSSRDLQSAADSVRKGVIMYSEGMAVTRDMPGIISGRVHNAIYLSPQLNLNKLIKPDFSIFRVCDVGEDIIHREIAISFFNGYGTELNMFHPGGRDDQYRSDLDFLSHTTFILRQNNDAFLDLDWTPLIETRFDSVYVNRWKSGSKTVFTILNMKPEGINGRLFRVDAPIGKHYVSLWRHESLLPEIINGSAYVKVQTEGWDKTFSGTRREGSVDCIAELPELIKPVIKGDSIKVNLSGSGKLTVWKGDPSYNTLSKELNIKNDTLLRLKDLFGFYEGKMVLQLSENGKLKDESIVMIKGGRPWLISKRQKSPFTDDVRGEMVLVPGSQLTIDLKPADDFIPYPDINGTSVKIDSFLIDKYPVTNAEYYEFVTTSGYKPADTTRYLRNWQSGIFKQGQDKYPVVFVSYEDMSAYARWSGKRLPTQAEWQLAAQGPVKRLWPWGDEFHGTLCNNSFGRPTPVDAFLKGLSPSGAADMVGNVWQMTADLYFDGTYYFAVIRGGSYYKPESSWWYIQGGPQELDKTQMMLMVSQGYDRSSTVGFRCVKDLENRNNRDKH